MPNVPVRRRYKNTVTAHSESLPYHLTQHLGWGDASGGAENLRI